MSLERAIDQLRHTLLRANVCGDVRLAITFENDRDLAWFKRQLGEDLKNQLWTTDWPVRNFDEFRLHGMHIRLIGDTPAKATESK